MSGIEEGGGNNNEQHNNIHAAAAAPPNDVMEQLAAGAFTTLCNHLRERGDRVQNIDLMAVGGFCRNCLAKWMVIGARDVARYIRTSRDLGTSGCLAGGDDERQQYYSSDPPYNNNWMDDANENEYDCILLIDTLDSFGYDEAALEVYGCAYSEWKVRHQKEEITEEQLRRYEESNKLHAKHDTNKLEARKKKNTANVHGVLPIKIMIHLRAYSFISLCRHLRSHSNQVTNIDLMSIGGFCRNCLAKWLVLHARTLSSQITTLALSSQHSAVDDSQQRIVELLNVFDYDMAAQYVYGCTYITWKERYQTKATDEQLEKYSNSKAIHAIHDDNLLAITRHHDVVRSSSSNADETFAGTTTSNKVQACTINSASRPVNNSLLSDVCCQDVDSLVAVPFQSMDQSSNRILPELPKGGHDIILKVGILTVSDRAYKNTYETGDLSGPAVENTIIGLVNQMNSSSFQETEDQQKTIVIQHIESAIVPDDVESIKEVLLRWSGKKSIKDDDELSSSYYDLVLTTGGTGFSSRDVTPEATNQILDRPCLGLMSWASMELTNTQPLATLSRAAAGTCRDTLIVNLPGNPAGAAQVVELLFPLLLYAIKDLQSHK